MWKYFSCITGDIKLTKYIKSLRKHIIANNKRYILKKRKCAIIYLQGKSLIKW